MWYFFSSLDVKDRLAILVVSSVSKDCFYISLMCRSHKYRIVVVLSYLRLIDIPLYVLIPYICLKKNKLYEMLVLVCRHCRQIYINALCLTAWRRPIIQIQLCINVIIWIITFSLQRVPNSRQTLQVCTFRIYSLKLRESYFLSFPTINLFVFPSLHEPLKDAFQCCPVYFIWNKLMKIVLLWLQYVHAV